MDKNILRSSFKPMYLQISDIIRELIENKELTQGDRIWSEREIMEKFNVSRNTAQGALEELVRNGLVRRIQGKGTFINDARVDYGLQNLISFSEATLMKGKTPHSKILAFTREEASKTVAQKLGLEPGGMVFRLSRLRLSNDLPMMHETSYLPEALFKDLSKFDFTEESLFDILENTYHVQISWQKQIIRPIISTKEEAELLGVSIGVPLILTEGVTYLVDNTPVEVNQLIYRSDLYELSIISKRR